MYQQIHPNYYNQQQRYPSRERTNTFHNAGRNMMNQDYRYQNEYPPIHQRNSHYEPQYPVTERVRGYSRDQWANQPAGPSSMPVMNQSFSSRRPSASRTSDLLFNDVKADQLLDKYAMANGLDDHFSNFARAPLPQIQKKPDYAQMNREMNKELSYSLMKQNILLEDINKKMERRSMSSNEFKDLEEKVQDFKKKTKLKMKLLKQDQKIEMLTQNHLMGMKVPTQADIISQSLLAHNFPHMYKNYPNPLAMNLLAQGLWNQGHHCPQCAKEGLYPTHHHHRNHSPEKHRYEEHKIPRIAVKPRHERKISTDTSLLKDRKPKSERNRNKRQPVNNSLYHPRQSRQSRQSRQWPDQQQDSEVDDDEYFDDRDSYESDPISNLKKVLWALLYPILLENHLVKKILARKNHQLQILLDTQSEALRGLTSWVFDLSEGSFLNLFLDKSVSYDFVELDPTKVVVQDQTKKQRARLVQTKLLTFFEEMNSNLKSYPMNPVHLEYLAAISLKEMYAQSNIFSNYEVMRLGFNTYGRIVSMTRDQSQMIIAVNLLIRVLVYKLILGLESWYSGALDEQILLNFKIIGSVLYRLIFSIWERKNPVMNPRPSKLPLITTSPLIIDKNISVHSIEPDDPEIIVGTFTLQQMTAIFANNPEWISQITTLIQEWIDEVYKKVVNYRKSNPQKKI